MIATIIAVLSFAAIALASHNGSKRSAEIGRAEAWARFEVDFR
jgi:hypothetical protein